MIEQTDRQLINSLQLGLPLRRRPFAELAADLGISEEEIVERLRRLLDDKVLSRFGPMYDAVALGGEVTLAALAVPTDRFDEVAGIVNGFDEVAHNYEREHRYNMWFVVAAESRAEIARVLAAIEEKTGLCVLNLPKEEEYFLNLRLDA
jgi:DNA-binding Lrp family transcriptional regulator